MDRKLFNSLLHQGESEVLDFRRDQYPFAGEDGDTKGELVKDILAFANAWKRTDAYILMGVEENPGGKANVVGVSYHLKDADLQQLVNSKTNKPVKFGYSAIEIDGKQVGIIRIDRDLARPIFLQRGFGKRKKGVVYVRRGSATVEAGPDEIAEMGAADAQQRVAVPVIEFEFADPAARRRFGHSIGTRSVILVDPPAPRQPGPEELRENLETLKQLDIGHQLAGLRRILRPAPFLQGPSRKELRAYREQMWVLTRIGFWAKNSGSVAALDVRIEIRGNKPEGLTVVDEEGLPEKPANIWGKIHSVCARVSDVRVQTYEDYWVAFVHVGKIQPQAEVWVEDLLYVGSRAPMQVKATARIFADNLLAPVKYPLTIEIETEEKVYREEDFEATEESDG